MKDSTSVNASSRGRTLAILFLVVSALLAVVSIVVFIFLDSRGSLPILIKTPLPITETLVKRVAANITDVPVISAIPPTSTPSATPTDTPTPTPTATDTPTFLPTFTNTPIPATATRTPKPVALAKRCVSVIGDSVAHGDGVFEVPGIGYFTGQLAPVSAFVQQQYQSRGDGTMKVFNRSASAVGISSANHPSFFNTVEYAQLLTDGCQYSVIIPWLNDLSSGIDAGTSAANHIQALGSLVQALTKAAPQGKILIVSYYNGAPAPFALSTFASGFTGPTVAAFNQQISGACASGVLASGHIRCVDVNPIFADMGQGYLLGAVARQDLLAMLSIPPSADTGGMIDLYFTNNPGGFINGDGVHLSNSGKARLASALVGMMP